MKNTNKGGGVFVVVFDDNFKCTYVSFEVIHKNQKELIGVMLPPSRVKDIGFYQICARLIEDKALRVFKGMKFSKDDENYLHNPKAVSIIHDIYKNLDVKN